MNSVNKVFLAMIEFYKNDPKRIQHFTKVHSYAKLIGDAENIDSDVLHVLEIASLTHDIGIKIAEEKYNSCTGKLQEQEGIEPAYNMLVALKFEPSIIDRVCYLIAHHHTYKNVDGADYQILLEADFLVNLYEDGVSEVAVNSALKNIFKTKTGISICKSMFLND
ncbi:MAG: phosphohydrolase [Bacillota bacterium]